MLVNADIYVKDIPGQLVSALEPMSTVNANIIGVVHSRDQMISGRIAVNITFDIDPENIDSLKEIWTSRDVIVAKIDSVVKTHTIEYMVIGDVTAGAMESMLEDAKNVVDIVSSDIRISSKSSGKNTAMVDACVRSPEDKDRLDSYIADRCRSAGFTYIRGVDQ